MIYLITYLLLGIAGIMSCRYSLVIGDRKIDSVEEKKGFLIFAVILISIIAALRSIEVGADTKSYVSIFEWFCNGMSVKDVKTYATTVEIVYLYFAKFISIFSESKVVFLSCHAIITYGLLLKYIRKHSENIIFSVMMFYALFYTSTLNLMRQYMAIALIVYALELLQEKKYKKVVVMSVLAVMLHASTILAIPILVISRLKNKNKYIIPFHIGILFVAVLIGSSSIVENVLRLLGYDRYVNRLQFTAGSTGIMAMVYVLIIGFGLLIWFKNRRTVSDDYCFYLMLSSTGTLFAVLSARNEMFVRVGAGYLFFIVILFPMILEELLKNTRIKKILMGGMYLLLFAATYVTSKGYVYTLSL